MQNLTRIVKISFSWLLFSSALIEQRTENSAVKLNLFKPTEENIRITGGPWFNATQLEKEYLLSLNPDRLLVDFKKTAGLKTNYKEYGGWEMESKELRGHTSGHYSDAISRMARLTNDSVLKARCFYTVKELNRWQQKIGKG